MVHLMNVHIERQFTPSVDDQHPKSVSFGLYSLSDRLDVITLKGLFIL